MDTEQQVAKHYGRSGLETSIVEALRKAGKDVDKLSADDLSGVDEFHLGWRPATAELAKQLGLASGMQVLDIGSGIGGPARYFAGALGCSVTGIDLTEEFVQAATGLTRRVGLADRVSFQQGSALALPFPDGRFDRATLIHVGMNIADKATLFAEVHRVLKPGGRFGVYEVMRTGAGDIPYPMPWAATSATSFVETPDAYRRLLEAADFKVESQRSQTELTLKLLGEMRAKAEKDGPPPLGLHVIMGAEAKERLANIFGCVENRLLAPTEIIAQAA
jgi:ubiquinone/menaquinone biosynthesis C-methylase UbiE